MNCVSSISSQLTSNASVVSAVIDLSSACARVTYVSTMITVPRMIALIEQLGFRASVMSGHELREELSRASSMNRIDDDDERDDDDDDERSATQAVSLQATPTLPAAAASSSSSSSLASSSSSASVVAINVAPMSSNARICRISVGGMTCASCTGAVEKEMQNTVGVESTHTSTHAQTKRQIVPPPNNVQYS
jgi:copper chaperone CopZ